MAPFSTSSPLSFFVRTSPLAKTQAPMRWYVSTASASFSFIVPLLFVIMPR